MMKDEDNKPEEDRPEEQHERHLNRPQDDRNEEETERRYMQRFRTNERKPSSSHWGYKNWPAPEQKETPGQEKADPEPDQEKRALLMNDDDREHSPTSTGKIPGPGNAEEDRDDDAK